MEISIVDTTLHSRRGYNFGGKHFINIWRGDILFEIIFLEKDQPEDSWFVGRRLRRDCYNDNNFLLVFPVRQRLARLLVIDFQTTSYVPIGLGGGLPIPQR